MTRRLRFDAMRLAGAVVACLLLSLTPPAALAAAAAAASPEKAASIDAEKFFAAIVKVQTHAVPNARSAATLGENREGTGIVIGERGLILTIGYLLVEADQVEVVDSRGRTLPATVVAYDHASGLGLVRPIPRFEIAPLRLGESAKVAERDPVLVVSHQGPGASIAAFVVAKRPFSANWEYMLDEAIFTSPPSLNWSGAALVDKNGALLGVGSLIVRDTLGGGTQLPGNMFIPIDALKPILADMVKDGHRSGPPRPWLGVAADEFQGRLMVTRVSPDGPAERAGIHSGDLILAVEGEPVHSQAEFYRKLWSNGSAGSEVSLRLLQGVDLHELKVQSIDRTDYFRPRTTY